MTDIAVIGGGPAGLTAAMYAARAGKNVAVYERDCIGGQITRAPLVENYPGTGTVSGLQLGDSMAAQAEAAGAVITFTDVQKAVKESSGIFRLDTDDGECYAKAVIYACGARPRTLGLPGEAELIGHGISYCALCDGSFFRKQAVAVVGGGSSAFADALLLSERCSHVTLIHRRSSFRAEQILVDRVKQRNNISLLTDTTVSELIRENELKPADIAKIEIGLSQSALRELVTPYPRDGEEAKFSIGFQIALYLNGLDNMPVNYREDVIRQPEIARIIQLTSMYNEPKYDNLPTDMGVGPAFGRITTVDGRVLTRERVYPDGHLTHPIPDQGIHDKYMKSALPVLGQEKAEELYRRLMALEEERDIRALLALCR